MDMEQEEMQFLGLFGIYKEAYKLIFRWRKIFTQITLSLILPLSLIFLAHEKIQETLYWKIWFTKFRLHEAKSGTPEYHRLSDLVSTEWAEYILFKILYFALVLVFSLLSTSAVVYTIASVYTSREITFKKVMSVVPKVWKRLMVTFVCALIAFFAYNMVFALTLYIWGATLDDDDDSVVPVIILWIILILYVIGFVYLTIIWHLASVFSVLEESYGIKAMIKSKRLIKGKMIVAIVIFFKLILSLFIISRVFMFAVVYGPYRRMSLFQVIGFGLLCLLVLLKIILFGLVVQTVIYFVCKSYHHENIDKSALSDHLEVYLGDYVPLTAKDVQMEEYHV